MRNKPRIRFKGFTEDWEQRKLGNLGSLKNGMNFSKEAMGKGYPFINLQNIFGSNVIDLTKLEKAEATDSQLKDYNLHKGDVLFVRSSVKLEGIGEAALISEDLKDTTFSGFIIRFRDNYGLDYNFKRFIFTTVLIRNQIMSQATNSANKNISQSVLNNLNLFIPTKDEQSKIGLIFSKLDKCITLHQRKLEKLKLAKKALLQKLFPKNGSQSPQIRFKGFTDAWEQRKLNDFGIATGGTSIESEFVDGGSYKVISIGSYSEESVYNDQGLRVNKTEKTKSRVLNKGNLTMILNDKTSSGNIIGRVLLIDQDNTYVYNQRTERIEVDTKNFLPIFLYHMLNAPEQRKYIVKASQGNTQIYVNWSTISNIDYIIPILLSEQEKIADLFSLINKNITLHQCKLDKLQDVKKGLLQKMFV